MKKVLEFIDQVVPIENIRIKFRSDGTTELTVTSLPDYLTVASSPHEVLGWLVRTVAEEMMVPGTWLKSR